MSFAFEVALKKACDDFHLKSWRQGEKFGVYLDKLASECKAYFEQKEDENFAASRGQCEKILHELLQTFAEQVGTRYSMPKGVGLKNFEKDLLDLKASYDKKAVGPARNDVLEKAEADEVERQKDVPR